MTTILVLANSLSWSAPYQREGYDVIHWLPTPALLTQAPPKTRIHGVLVAPPCKHLAGSGARWWAGKGEPALAEALTVVSACLRLVQATRPLWWSLENPAGRLSTYLGKPRHTFHPFEYGDPWTKRTCLWGRFTMPEKAPVEPTGGTRFWSASERKKSDEFIPPGFARAFFEANR